MIAAMAKEVGLRSQLQDRQPKKVLRSFSSFPLSHGTVIDIGDLSYLVAYTIKIGCKEHKDAFKAVKEAQIPGSSFELPGKFIPGTPYPDRVLRDNFSHEWFLQDSLMDGSTGVVSPGIDGETGSAVAVKWLMPGQDNREIEIMQYLKEFAQIGHVGGAMSAFVIPTNNPTGPLRQTRSGQ